MALYTVFCTTAPLQYEHFRKHKSSNKSSSNNNNLLDWRNTGGGGRTNWTEKQKIELVKVEANSDTQRVFQRLKAALEKQGFKIIKKEN